MLYLRDISSHATNLSLFSLSLGPFEHYIAAFTAFWSLLDIKLYLDIGHRPRRVWVWPG
jgi:hypothetical protein